MKYLFFIYLIELNSSRTEHVSRFCQYLVKSFELSSQTQAYRTFTSRVSSLKLKARSNSNSSSSPELFNRAGAEPGNVRLGSARLHP